MLETGTTYYKKLYDEIEKCNTTKKLDDLLNASINNMSDLHVLQYVIFNLNMYSSFYIANDEKPKKLPKTKNKILSIISEYIDENCEPGNLDNIIYSDYYIWLDDDIKKRILKMFIRHDYSDSSSNTILNWAVFIGKLDDNTRLELLDFFIRRYKFEKNRINRNYIKFVFEKVSNDYLDDACDIINKSSPLIKVILFSRSNEIKEKYLLQALKALSKLKGQVKEDIELNFSLLSKLSPKGRLDVIKQLFGMNDKAYKSIKWYKSLKRGLYYREVRRLKFLKERAIKPTVVIKDMDRGNLKQFLFPCSLKYNEDVKLILERYDELTNKNTG